MFSIKLTDFSLIISMFSLGDKSDLYKSFKIFSKIVKINGSADAIRIVNLVGDSYKTMYKYKSSNDLFLS